MAPVTVSRVPDIYPQPPGRRWRGMTNRTLTNSHKNHLGDWGHQLRRGKTKGSIRIMFQNMDGTDNASDKSSQSKLDNFKDIVINEGIAIV